MRPRQTESNAQILARLKAEMEARDRLAAGGQISEADVLLLEPADVTRAVQAGQLAAVGIGQPRRPR